MKTLILSDLHLGSKHSQPEQILHTLQREAFDRLILNGDTIHNLNLRKLKAADWRVIDKLRDLGRTRELILLRGNHDLDPVEDVQGFGPHSVLPALLGVPMHEEVQVAVGARRYVVLHGDRFDPTLNNPLVSEMAGLCYDFSRKISKKLAKWLKKKSKMWSGVLQRIVSESVTHAREQGFDGIMTGHTHFADDSQIDGIHYVNSGCWTEPPYSFLLLESQSVTLHHVPD
jgi:UDP-2,3-diacylglucosamine pyrophosphatase LpxH